jgi:hypothetical protein
MRGAIPPLPQYTFMAWWLVKHRDNFTFYLYGADENLETRRRTAVRHRHRWEDNILIQLKETGWEGVEWNNLAQDRDQWHALVDTVLKLRVP